MKEVVLFFIILCCIAPCSNAEETRATSVLLDISRSLSRAEFEKTKTIVQKWIDQDHAKVLSFYTFGSKLEKIEPEQLKTVAATESYTMFNDATYDVMQDLSKIDASKKTILIFSDGNDTKSATTIEDIVSFAKSEGIAIDCIGIGKANVKLLQRISKLTGGTFFDAGERDLIGRIDAAISAQQQARTPEIIPPQAAPSKQLNAPKPAIAVPLKSPEPELPATEESNHTLRLAIIAAAILLAGVLAFFVLRRKEEVRLCPTCGKTLESYQTICPECPGQTKILAVPKFVEEMKKEAEEADSVPSDWYELKQDTQEIMMKTTYLKESPVLVVTKGTNLGESYQLSKEAPISIGRSRINEIRPFDGSISAQHCRIIPENGRHVLYDLGSTNGTLLNNRKVTKAILKEGDTIEVGETILQYKVEHSR